MMPTAQIAAKTLRWSPRYHSLELPKKLHLLASVTGEIGRWSQFGLTGGSIGLVPIPEAASHVKDPAKPCIYYNL